MGKKVRSAMGVSVDFDALKIKQQLASTPSSTEVKARADSVEGRNNRRAARRAQQASKRAANLSNEIIDDELLDDQSDDSVDDEVLQDSVELQIDPTTPDATPTRKQQTRK